MYLNSITGHSNGDEWLRRGFVGLGEEEFQAVGVVAGGAGVGCLAAKLFC